MDVLNKFLQAEINSKEYYESIINFINLYEIRKGEFEGNEYVIMKMDRDNFIKPRSSAMCVWCSLSWRP